MAEATNFLETPAIYDDIPINEIQRRGKGPSFDFIGLGGIAIGAALLSTWVDWYNVWAKIQYMIS